MDTFNRSHSDGTYWLMRAEHLAVVAVCSMVALLHFRELNLWRFAAAFLVIDLAGYLPGLIAYLQTKKNSPQPRHIARGYHYLYNVMHSYLTWGVVVAVWWQCIGGQWEWAMLAVPIHLSGDRGVFGNVFKPVGRMFEPAKPDGTSNAVSGG